MRFCATPLPGVTIVEPDLHGDARGFFMESWHAGRFAEAGIAAAFVQDNHSRSGRGVLRGLHYQLTRPQGKLVRVTRGRAFDVVVDLRRGGGSFGRWFGLELSEANRRMLWVPSGFAHGFLALDDATEILYKCTDFYVPEDERALLWSDPALDIDWPLAGISPILSAKDQAAVPLAQAQSYP